MNFGIIGVGVMGRNLALNLADNNTDVVLFDLWADALNNLSQNAEFDRHEITISDSLEDFCTRLSSPKRILLMVKAGETVDHHIDLLRPFLEEGDIVIDGGNSQYEDTQKRADDLLEKSIHFVGLGVSGGETGARHGPSLMAGTTQQAFDIISPALSSIAAKAPKDGASCLGYLGQGGAGHFVKTIHNGIEYADMQLIAEVASFLTNRAGISAQQAGEIFTKWNEGKLASYLVEITGKLLQKSDIETDQPLVNVILDKAGQKGTGRWTSEAMLKYGVAAPSLVEAVTARALSAIKETRVKATASFTPARAANIDLGHQLDLFESAMFLCKFAIYAQGLDVIRAAATEHEWDLDMVNTARIWRAGCIIRADMLEDIAAAYSEQPDLENLLLSPAILTEVQERLSHLRDLVILFVKSGHPAPVLMSTLSYIEGLFTDAGSANIIQAQRDFFGAHTYERTDKEGTFHTEWEA